MSFTKDLTLSIEFSEILTVFIGKIAEKVNMKKGKIKHKESGDNSSKRLMYGENQNGEYKKKSSIAQFRLQGKCL